MLWLKQLFVEEVSGDADDPIQIRKREINLM